MQKERTWPAITDAASWLLNGPRSIVGGAENEWLSPLVQWQELNAQTGVYSSWTCFVDAESASTDIPHALLRVATWQRAFDRRAFKMGSFTSLSASAKHVFIEADLGIVLRLYVPQIVAAYSDASVLLPVATRITLTPVERQFKEAISDFDKQRHGPAVRLMFAKTSLHDGCQVEWIASDDTLRLTELWQESLAHVQERVVAEQSSSFIERYNVQPFGEYLDLRPSEMSNVFELLGE